jgi:zinc/manganese transport system substrate-binding protein
MIRGQWRETIGIPFGQKGSHRRTNTRQVRKFTAIAAFAAACLLLAACTGRPDAPDSARTAFSADSGKIRIVAAESFYGEAAEAIGGDRVEVVSLVNGQKADPHDFDPPASASRAVHNAALVIYNGIGYDDWMAKLIQASGTKSVIRVAEDVLGKQAGDNEHVWMHPDTMAAFANAFADRLSELDPGNTSSYRERAADYIKTLAPIHDLIGKIKQPASVDVDVSEPVFDYMLQALNFRILNPAFAKALEDETDPAPADLAQTMDDLKLKRIKLFVKNKQTDSPIVTTLTQLAQQNDVPVIEVTETAPPGQSYVEWISSTLRQISVALGDT